MLCIRKETKNDPVWCSYASGVDFLINPLTASIITEIRKPFIKKGMGVNPSSRQIEITETMSPEDEDKLNDALIDYLIRDWKGVCDENENPLPCTLDNKKAAMDIADISEFVFKSARAIPTLSVKGLEEELGN